MRKILLTLALFTATILSAKSAFPVDPEAMDPYYFVSNQDYYPQEIYGGLKLDSVLWKDYKYGVEYTFFFDAEGRMTKADFKSDNHFQVFYSYDAKGNCVQSIAQQINITNQWEDVQKAEYTRDTKGRATSVTFSVLSEGKWSPFMKYEWTYDEHDNLTLATAYVYQDDLAAWKKTGCDKHDYQYNAKGLKTESVYKHWDSTFDWVLEDKLTYEYDDQGRVTKFTDYDWSNIAATWKAWKETTTAYSDPGDDGVVIALAITNRWNSGANKWDAYSMEGYNYTDGKETYYTISYMVDSKWEISFVRTTTYNNKGQIAEVEEKDNGGITRIEYTYDDFGNRTARLKSTNGQSVYGERWFFSVREGIDEIFSDKQNIKTRKVLHNGQLYIIRNNTIYSPDGKEIR